MPVGPKPNLCLMDKGLKLPTCGQWVVQHPRPRYPPQGREPSLHLCEILTRLCHLSQDTRILQAKSMLASETEKEPGLPCDTATKLPKLEAMCFSLSLPSGQLPLSPDRQGCPVQLKGFDLRLSSPQQGTPGELAFSGQVGWQWGDLQGHKWEMLGHGATPSGTEGRAGNDGQLRCW